MTFGRHWVAAAVVPLILGACSGEAEPRFEAPPTETPTVSESAPAPAPEAWEQKTRKGALAFVDHWIAAFNAAVADGDTSSFMRLSGRDCATCANFAKAIAGIYKSGGSFKTRGWKMTGYSFSRPEVSNDVSLALTIHQPVETTLLPGEAPQKSKPGEVSYQANLAWREGRWLMDGLFFVGEA